MSPPASTIATMIATTSIGSTCSVDRASDDNASPTTADTIAVIASVRYNSVMPAVVLLPRSTPPCCGAPLPTTMIAVRMAVWISAAML